MPLYGRMPASKRRGEGGRPLISPNRAINCVWRELTDLRLLLYLAKIGYARLNGGLAYAPAETLHRLG